METPLVSLAECVAKPTDNSLRDCSAPLRLTLILWAIGPSLAPAHPPYPSRAGANAVSTEVRSPVLKVSSAQREHAVPRRHIAQETDIITG
jgi:hypothetical protein